MSSWLFDGLAAAGLPVVCTKDPGPAAHAPAPLAPSTLSARERCAHWSSGCGRTMRCGRSARWWARRWRRCRVTSPGSIRGSEGPRSRRSDAAAGMTHKTDRNDARGIAQVLRTGWFKAVHVKTAWSQERRTLLMARKTMLEQAFDIENTRSAAWRCWCWRNLRRATACAPFSPAARHSTGPHACFCGRFWGTHLRCLARACRGQRARH